MYQETKGEPRTPFEVSGAVFRETLTLYEQCFALAETLATSPSKAGHSG